jgi:hypothetical protein
MRIRRYNESLEDLIEGEYSKESESIIGSEIGRILKKVKYKPVLIGHGLYSILLGKEKRGLDKSEWEYVGDKLVKKLQVSSPKYYFDKKTKLTYKYIQELEDEYDIWLEFIQDIIDESLLNITMECTIPEVFDPIEFTIIIYLPKMKLEEFVKNIELIEKCCSSTGYSSSIEIENSKSIKINIKKI